MAAACSYVNSENVVRLLIKHRPLLERWLEFCESLGSEAQDIQRWDYGIKTAGFKHYEVFSQILRRWVSQNQNRCINDVCNVLLIMELDGVSEELLQRFGKDDLIILPVNRQTEPDKQLIEDTGPEILNQVRRYEKKIKWPITLLQRQKTPTKNFTGRKKEFKVLYSYFKGAENLILICGFGGIGKTEFCKKFAHDIHYHNIFGFPTKIITDISRIWLHGETIETLKESILKVGKRLGLPYGSDLSPVEYFNDLVEFILQNSPRLLVIIDNVDVKYNEVLKVVKIAKDYSQIFVIVTSRNSMVFDTAGITMKLDVLEKKDALDMLQKSSLCSLDSDCNKLCELVQFYPLALQQAIAYIKQQRARHKTQNYSVSDYVREFERKKSTLLGHELNKIEHDYSMTTLVTWNMTIQKMSASAVKILNMLAHLDPDGIEIAIIDEIYNNLNVEGSFEADLDLLHNYALIKIDNGIISIHRLIQEVMRLSNNNVGYLETLFDATLIALVKLRKDESPRFKENDLQHINLVAKFAFSCQVGKLDRFCAVLHILLKNNRIECAEEYIKMECKNFNFLFDLNITLKYELLEKVLLFTIVQNDNLMCNEDIEKWSFGEFDHNFYLPLIDVALHLATKHFHWKEKMCIEFKIKVAKNILENNVWGKYDFRATQCILLCKDVINSPMISAYECALETILLAKNIKVSDKRSKFKIFEEILESKIEKLGENHSNVMSLKEMMAMLFEKIGQFELALQLFEQIKDFAVQFEAKKDELDQHLWNVARSKLRLYNVVNIKNYNELSDNDVSLKDLKKLLDSYTTVLGENDSFVLKIKNKIALQLCQEQKYMESESILEEVFQSNSVLEINFGFNTLRLIGEHLYCIDDYAKSQELLEKVHHYQVHSLGNCHKDTVKTKQSLANVTERLGSLTQAFQLQIELVNYYENKENIDTHSLFKNLNCIRHRIKKIKNKIGFSLSSLEKILEISAIVLGDDHILVIEAKIVIARALKLKDNNRSIILCKEVFDSQFDTEYKEAYNILVEALDIESNYQEQEIGLEGMLKSKKLKVGEGHSNMIRIMEILGDLKKKQGSFESALQLFKHVRDCVMTCQWNDIDIKCVCVKLFKLNLQLGKFFHDALLDIDTEFDLVKACIYDIPLQCIRQVLGFYVNKLGNKHTFVLQLTQILASRFLKENNLDELHLMLEEIIASNNTDQLKLGCIIMTDIANSNACMDFNEKTTELLEKILQLQTLTFGDDHQETVRTKADFANVFEVQGTFYRALQLQIELVKYYENESNNDKLSSSDITYFKNLNCIRQRIKKIKNKMGFSLSSLEKILELSAIVLGDDHTLVIEAKIVVARALTLKDSKRSIILCKEVFDSQFDKEYKEAYNILVEAIGIELNYQEQEILLEEMLKSKNLKVGEDHSNMIRIMEMLGDIKEKQGSFESALQLFKHVRDCGMTCQWNEIDLKSVRIKLFKLNLQLGEYFHDVHLDIDTEFDLVKAYIYSIPLNSIIQTLGFYVHKLGNDNKFVLQFKQIVTSRLLEKKTLGDFHVMLEEVLASQNMDELKLVLSIMTDITNSNVFIDFNEKTIGLLESILQLQTLTLGDDHEETVRTKVHFANVFEVQGKFHRALQLRIEALRYYEEQNIKDPCSLNDNYVVVEAIKNRMKQLKNNISIYDMKHKEPYKTLITMLENEDNEKQQLAEYFDEIPLMGLRNILTFYKNQFGNKHKKFLQFKHAIALQFSKPNKLSEFQLMLEEVLMSNDIEELNLVLITIRAIPDTKLLCFDFEEKSKELLEKILHLQILAIGEDQEETVKIKEDFAYVLECQGQFYRALRLQIEALKYREAEIIRDPCSWTVNSIILDSIKSRILQIRKSIGSLAENLDKISLLYTSVLGRDHVLTVQLYKEMSNQSRNENVSVSDFASLNQKPCIKVKPDPAKVSKIRWPFNIKRKSSSCVDSDENLECVLKIEMKKQIKLIEEILSLKNKYKIEAAIHNGEHLVWCTNWEELIDFLRMVLDFQINCNGYNNKDVMKTCFMLTTVIKYENQSHKSLE